MRSNYKQLGKYIRVVSSRNVELKNTILLGVNIDKFFMPSVANIVGTDMATYKIVKKGQFACNRMHVGRDYRLPVALSENPEDFLVSPAYDVFEVIDSETLLPEYLMMWFSRKEFDRNAWFYTDADVRGGLSWKAFCEMGIPILNIERQKEIVNKYNVIVDRIALNNKIIAKLEETAQAIYKQWFVDFEFPDENNEPYKSSGGKMEFNEKLEKEIPIGWEVDKLGEIIKTTSGKTPFDKSEEKTELFKYPIYGAGGIMGYSSRFLFNEKILSTGRVGTHGIVKRINFPCWASDNTLVIKSEFYEYVNQILNNINYDEINKGGVQGLITKTDINNTKTFIPKKNVLNLFENKIGQIMSFLDSKLTELEKLKNLTGLLLSKLATTNN